METPIIDSPNQSPQPDRDSLLRQLKDIESRIQDFEREREKIAAQAPYVPIQEAILTPDLPTREKGRQYKMLTAEELREQVLLLFFNIHNNLPEHSKIKSDPSATKQLFKEIESRIQSLSKMLQQIKIEEELEGLISERDKVKSDLANLNQQSKFGFYKKKQSES